MEAGRRGTGWAGQTRAVEPDPSGSGGCLAGAWPALGVRAARPWGLTAVGRALLPAGALAVGGGGSHPEAA